MILKYRDPESLTEEGLLFQDILYFFRIERLGLHLRKFCDEFNEDPYNWNKLEGGRALAPQDPVRLKQIADILGIKNPQELTIFRFAALLGTNSVAKGTLLDENAVKKLPLLLAEISRCNEAGPLLDKLMQIVKESDSYKGW